MLKFANIINNSKSDYVSLSNNCSSILEEYYFLCKNLELLIENMNMKQFKEYGQTESFDRMKNLLNIKNLTDACQKIYRKTKHTYNNGIKLFNYYLKIYGKENIVKDKMKPIIESRLLYQAFSYKEPKRNNGRFE